ncbi:MAG TPA: EB domain-containing protein, partial [Polyangiaceae bacterium]|nr:EB domain-containing protein [Polyangiaceae bacterium]
MISAGQLHPVACLLAALLAAASVSAQEAAPPPPAEAPAPAPVECTPACQSGTFCSNGQCLSKCTPPCGADEVCTDDAQCVLVLPPSAPPPPPPPPAGVAPPPRPVEPLPPPPPATEVEQGVHLHDGFYFRGALGVGALFGSNSTVNGALLVASAGDFDSSGIAVLSELALGGSPLPGLVIGGGSYGASVPSTSYEVAGSEIEGGTSAVSVLGPFIDIYPDPSAGLHLQFAPGLGAMNVNEGDFASDTIGGLGFGFMAGAGYEFWIG